MYIFEVRPSLQAQSSKFQALIKGEPPGGPPGTPRHPPRFSQNKDGVVRGLVSRKKEGDGQAERSRTTTADHVVAILDQEVTATPFDPDAFLHARPAAFASMPRVVAVSEEIPAAVRALHGHAAAILETYGGDAACSIHSVYGESRDGFIRMDRPRQFLRDAFGETAAEFAARVQDPNVVADVAGVLWQDLLKPCVHRAVHGDGPGEFSRTRST